MTENKLKLIDGNCFEREYEVIDNRCTDCFLPTFTTCFVHEKFSCGFHKPGQKS